MNHIVHCRISRQELVALIRAMPAILAGKVPDHKGIAAGFKARVAFTFISLVKESFEAKGRGMTGSDGVSWPPLKEKTVERKLAKGMTKGQVDRWKGDYKAAFRHAIAHMSDAEARKFAEQSATKAHEQRTGRQVPSGTTQMLVDNGLLRQSLTIGTLAEQGPAAHYSPPNEDQRYEDKPGEAVIGTNVKHAVFHHRGTKRNGQECIPARKFWPEDLPGPWLEDITRQASLGLQRIIELIQ